MDGKELVDNKSVKIKKVGLFRILSFTDLNMQIHRKDPIFREASDSTWKSIKFFTNFTLKVLKQSKYHLIVDNKVAGALALEKKGNSIFVYAIGVKEEYRRQGYGSYLMQFTEQFAKKHNKAYVCFSVLLENKPAIAMYNKLDYKSLGIGLTLVRTFLWKLEDKMPSEHNLKIGFRKIENQKEVKEKTYHWWTEEIEAFAGMEACELAKKDSLLELDLKAEWSVYEIITDNVASGVLAILPSDLFQSIVLFSDPSRTWNQDWSFAFISTLQIQKLIALNQNRKVTDSSKQFKLNNSSILQFFLTQQHKDNMIASLGSSNLSHNSNEDRQILYKKIV